MYLAHNSQYIDKVKRSKVKVTMANEIVHKTSNICRKRHSEVEMH